MLVLKNAQIGHLAWICEHWKCDYSCYFKWNIFFIMCHVELLTCVSCAATVTVVFCKNTLHPVCSHCARACLATQMHRDSLALSYWHFALTICFPKSSPFSLNKNVIQIYPMSADVVAHLLNKSHHRWQSWQRAHWGSGMGTWPREWDACWGLLDDQKHLLAIVWEAFLSPASIRARFASVCS